MTTTEATGNGPRILYWVEWKDRQGRWHREQADYERSRSEAAARWYGKDRHAATRIIAQPA